MDVPVFNVLAARATPRICPLTTDAAVFHTMRTPRTRGASSHHLISIPHLAPAAVRPADPPASHAPQGPRERARVRSCVGMAVCAIEGAGPRGASGELACMSL